MNTGPSKATFVVPMTDDALRALPKVELHCHLELTAPTPSQGLLQAKGRRGR